MLEIIAIAMSIIVTTLVIGKWKEDSRGFYRFIKSKRRESIGIPPFKVNKYQISDNDKANCLNNYFSLMFTNKT